MSDCINVSTGEIQRELEKDYMLLVLKLGERCQAACIMTTGECMLPIYK